MGAVRVEGKRILILGFGREGRSVLEFLSSKGVAAAGVGDRLSLGEFPESERAILHSLPPKRLHLGEGYLDSLREYDIVVKAPGIPLLPEIRAATEAGLEITSATNLFLAETAARVVGITGTKGKSTTASLLHAMLSAEGLETRLVGNIGKPALAELEKDHAGRIYCYELSSYQIETLAGEIAGAIFLNLFPEHLDYHGGKERYYAAKLRLLHAVRGDGFIVYGRSNPLIAQAVEPLSCRCIPFPNEESYLSPSELFLNGAPLLERREIPLLGEHNHMNGVAAAVAADALGASRSAIAAALQNFSPLEHRLEDVGIVNGIRFINDSISTTPESTIAALRALNRVATLIVGGTDRGYDFKNLAEEIIKQGVKTLILLPETGRRIAETIEAVKAEPPHMISVDSMQHCVEQALLHTAAGALCLLSPASPSYGLFKNFEDRGRQFKDAIILKYTQGK